MHSLHSRLGGLHQPPKLHGTARHISRKTKLGLSEQNCGRDSEALKTESEDRFLGRWQSPDQQMAVLHLAADWH